MSHHHHASTENAPTQDYSPELGHIQPIKIYVTIFVLLLILTVVTVGAAFMDFGVWDLAIAMGIASVKATLVALFFMHLKYEHPFTWIYAAIPIFILFLLIGGVFLDNPMRGHPEKTQSRLEFNQSISFKA